MDEYTAPEMTRSPLEELCLEVASLRLGAPAEFLADAISPPKGPVVQHSVSVLYNLGAVRDRRGALLTPLGEKLARLQVPVACAWVHGSCVRCGRARAGCPNPMDKGGGGFSPSPAPLPHPFPPLRRVSFPCFVPPPPRVTCSSSVFSLRGPGQSPVDSSPHDAVSIFS